MKSLLENKQGFLQVSFPWLFAMIVGALILFLAIYGVTRLISTEETIQDIKVSRELGILLNPLETGFEEAKTSSLSFAIATRITNKCNSLGNFGQQYFQVSQKSFGEWTKTDIQSEGFPNKYIFSKELVEGEKMLIFAKPFDFPFKVADLIYITSSDDKFCFIDSPDNIQEELDNLNQENLLIGNCEDDEGVTKVCFSSMSSDNCHMVVDYTNGYVDKRGESLHFEGDALMYGAIFADEKMYECGLKRLMKKTSNLITLYKDKADLIQCGADPDFIQLINSVDQFGTSRDLEQISSIVQRIESRNNQNSLCRLW